MSKSPEQLIAASQLYIECQMSIASIAKRLNISEKTLHNWKKENDWNNKRARFLKMQYSTNQTLYELLHLLAKKAIDDFKEEGTLPDQKTLYFIMGMADKLPKLKSFEKQEVQEKVEELTMQNKSVEDDKKQNTEEMMQKFFNAIIG